MRSLFLIFFSIICLSLSGQEYKNLVVEGNSWSVVNWSWDWAWTEYLFIDGDTVINDTTYAKLYSTSDSTLQSHASYSCGLREDNISKEVFFYYNSYLGDKLLYKFGLDVGDSVLVTSLACDAITMIVSDVDTITDLMGIERRRMVMEHWYDWKDEYWIEGIGSTLGLLTAGNISCIADFNQDLLCFSQLGELNYMNPMFAKCHITHVSIEEKILSKDQIFVSPNPVTGVSEINIKNDIHVSVYKLYNCQGQLAAEPHISDHKIEKGNLIPGVYFLKVETDRGEIMTIKVLVQ